MKTFRDIIDAWPSRSEFATELGVPYERANQWYKRDSVPAQYWNRLVQQARTRTDGISLSVLADAAEHQRLAAEASRQASDGRREAQP